MAFGENPLVAELKQVVTVLQKSIFKYETYVFFRVAFAFLSNPKRKPDIQKLFIS